MTRWVVFWSDLREAAAREIFGKEKNNPHVLSLVVHFLLVILFGPLAYICALFVKIFRPRMVVHLMLFLISDLWLLLFLSFPIAFLVAPFSVTAWWLVATPVFYFVLLLMFAYDGMRGLFRKRTVEDELREQHERELKQAEKDRQKAVRKAGLDPKGPGGRLFLGTLIKGDDFPEYLGVSVEKNGWVSIGDELLDRHMFILGSTGAGKSESLLRIIDETLKKSDRRLYFIDGKGDLDMAGRIATLAFDSGRGQVPIFKLGHKEKGSIYNGFEGSAEDVYNRLSSMLGVLNVEGGAAYYADLNKGLLQLICGVGHPRLNIAPPRSFPEVQRRLTGKWLFSTYRSVPEEKGLIELAQKSDQLTGLAFQLSNLNRSFGDIVNDEGFSLEAVNCAIFSLRTQSASVDAKKFLDFFIEDVKDWIGKRQPKGARGLLIIDEFGTFRNQNITDVLSLARSSKLGVILATQDTATLGDTNTARRILANCNTYLLMKTNFPEELTELAGTVYRIEASQQTTEGGQATGVGSARVQHQYKINPNEVPKMAPGEAFLINSRFTAKIQMKQVPEIEINERAIAAGLESRTQQTRTSTKDDDAAPTKPNLDIE